MKNLFFTIIGLLSLILTTNAQNVQFGVRAGINLSNLSANFKYHEPITPASLVCPDAPLFFNSLRW